MELVNDSAHGLPPGTGAASECGARKIQHETGVLGGSSVQ
jgi:hypothetical protein